MSTKGGCGVAWRLAECWGGHRREARLPTGVWQISAKRRGHPHCGVAGAEVGERVSICRDEPARESECKQGILPGEGAGSVMQVWYTPRHQTSTYTCIYKLVYIKQVRINSNESQGSRPQRMKL